MRPVTPSACATLEAQLWFMMWKKRVDFIRSRLWSAPNSRKNSSMVCGLPVVEPIETPSAPPASSSGPSPAMATASWLAKVAKTDMLDMARRNLRGISIGSTPVASAATRVRIPVISESPGSSTTPLLPANSPSIRLWMPRPKGETVPIPVMTTLLSNIP